MSTPNPIPRELVPVTAQPVTSNVQENETVQGQLRGLLDQGNPVLRQARNRAVVYAADRGLQNSTLAAQAGEEAYIGAAAPIAAADAQTYAQRSLVNTETINRFGLQEQGGNISSRLQGEQGDISSRLQREGGDINSRLQGEQGDINSRLQREQSDYRMGEVAFQANHDVVMAREQFQSQQSLMAQDFAGRLNLTRAESAAQIERMNVQHAQTLTQIEANASAQTGINSAQFTQQLQGSYLTAVSNRQTAASAEIQTIYTTQGLSSAQQQTAVANAYSRMQTDMAALSAFYRQAPAWDSNWNSGTPAPPTGGFPAPGGTPQQPLPPLTSGDLRNTPGVTVTPGGRLGPIYTLPDGTRYRIMPDGSVGPA